MAASLEHRAPQPPAWADLKRVAVDTHPGPGALGEPEEVSIIAAGA